jgi:hypothetical protein
MRASIQLIGRNRRCPCPFVCRARGAASTDRQSVSIVDRFIEIDCLVDLTVGPVQSRLTLRRARPPRLEQASNQQADQETGSVMQGVVADVIEEAEENLNDVGSGVAGLEARDFGDLPPFSLQGLA